mgnify:CR=1 FL=1
MSEDKKAMEAATEEAAGGERREKNFIENEIDKIWHREDIRMFRRASHRSRTATCTSGTQSRFS